MNSVIISDYGVMLAKTGERLVIRGHNFRPPAEAAASLAPALNRQFT